MIDADPALCGACWGKLNFVSQPCCVRCGLPFAFAAEAVTAPFCGACAALASKPVPLDRSRAALVYDPASRDLLLAFKHADRTETAGLFARFVARAGSELLDDADLLVPVPLHRWRLFRRRYNQSALLAQSLAKLTHLTVVPDLLTRTRATPSQGSQHRTGRVRNVAGAFAVTPRLSARVDGARILLIDDVHTTGATLSECAKVLKRSGAARVDALTVARVVIEG